MLQPISLMGWLVSHLYCAAHSVEEDRMQYKVNECIVLEQFILFEKGNLKRGL